MNCTRLVIRLRGRAKGGNFLLFSEPFPILVHGIGNYPLRQIPKSGGNLHTTTNLLKNKRASNRIKKAVFIVLTSQKDFVILFYKSDFSIIRKGLTCDML